MKIIVNKRPKDSSECILKSIVHEPIYKFECDGKCDTCKYIQTYEEYYDANNPEITNDGYDD